MEIPAVAKDVRVVLRSYLTVIFFLIAFVGNRCCVMRVRLRLYQRRLVDIQEMTGWLANGSLASAVTSFRATPAGWLGVIMLVVLPLSIGGDLAVAGLVVSTQVADRCSFNMTGVYSIFSDHGYGAEYGLRDAISQYALITGAQTTSQINKGIDGIYRKVNSDPRFRAEEKDIVAQWECAATGEERTFHGPYDDDHELTIIENKLSEEGLLSGTGAKFSRSRDGTPLKGAFVWSRPIGPIDSDDSTIPAAVQINSASDPTRMKMFSCAINAPSRLYWIPTWVHNGTFVHEWGAVIWAGLFPQYVRNGNDGNYMEKTPNPASFIASKLNTATMLAAQSLSDDTSPGKMDDATQGCLTLQTQVHWLVVALILLATLLVMGLSAYLVMLYFRVRSVRKFDSPAYVKAVQESTPHDLPTWMRHATNETNQKPQVATEAPEARAWTSNWRFGPANSGESRVGLIYLADVEEQKEPLTRSEPPNYVQEEYLKEG